MTWGIIGQERAVAVLRRAVEDEARLAHAYLFAGPERVGRATTARRFAQALNCAEGGRSSLPPSHPGELLREGDTPSSKLEAGGSRLEDQPPCGDCRACRHIAEDKHPDVEWVTPGGLCEEPEHKDHADARDIRICQVRRLERVVSRTPFEARYRVVIIDPADAMTTEAANAFLKTLEEPPAHVVLALISAHEELLPATVRSRCRRIAFSGVPRAAIEAALVERWGTEPEQAERLARLAQGRLGWAVAALEDARLLIERERAVDEVEALLGKGISERFSAAASLGARFQREPQSVLSTLEVWRDWWRDVFLAAAGREELIASAERLDTLRAQAAHYGVREAVQALAVVRDACRHLEEHANPTLALEAMLLELPSPAGR